MSGWPCVDYSLAGKQLGLQGKSVPVALAVGARGNLSKQVVNAIECSDRMPLQLLPDAFGNNMSDWHTSIVTPADAGFEMIQRRRHLG